MKPIRLFLLTALMLAAKFAGAQTSNFNFDEVNNTGNLQEVAHSSTQPYTSDLFLYPNPVANVARILLPYVPQHRVNVIMLNFNGNIVQSWIYAPGGNQLDVDMTAVPGGLYSLRVQEYGYLPDFIKVIKQE